MTHTNNGTLINILKSKPQFSTDPSVMQYTLRVTIPEYGKSHDEFFTVMTSDCVIEGFNLVADPNRNFTYDIGANQIQVPYPAIIFEPSYCIYDVEKTVTLLGTNTTPTFIHLDTDHFDIYTANPSKIGSYILEIKFQPQGPSTAGP